MVNKKISERKKRIKNKENEIRHSGNKINLTDDITIDTMNEFGIEDYRIDPWGDIRINSAHGNWIVRSDDEVIYLWHRNEGSSQAKSDRNSYHLQNVFYDLPYCVGSIVEHDEYVLRRKNRIGTKGRVAMRL